MIEAIPNLLNTNESAESLADNGCVPAAKTSANPIRRRVRSMLWRSGYLQLRRVAIKSSEDGHIRLDGQVCTYYLKQLAQVAAQHVDGVETLDNAIKVVPIATDGSPDDVGPN